MDKKVSIIIPNYNGWNLLAKNLPQVIKAARKYNPDVEIIVVDDDSNDKSVSFVKQNFPKVVLIKKEVNEGFSSACNLGVKKSNGDIIVLLNSDVVPEDNFLSPLINHFKDQNVFSVGCLDRSLEDKKVIYRGRGVGWFRKGLLIHRRGEIDKTNTLWTSGGSSAYDKKKWMELGGFDEIYNPFYWEDIDLSYRAQKRGRKVLFEPKSVVNHYHQEGIIKNKFNAEQIKTIAYRNQLIFVWKNITDTKYIILHFLWLPFHILKALWQFDTAFIKGLFQAMFRILIRMPHKDRLKILKDEEILARYIRSRNKENR